ncbi:hypothetical protein ACLESO_41820, partial [Pyxidicoccus sp. 3LG]
PPQPRLPRLHPAARRRGVHSPGPGASGVTSPTLEFEMAEQQNNVVACPDLATQDTCLQDAEERGLLVQNPWGTLEVPRYEARTGLPEGALSARHPVSL